MQSEEALRSKIEQLATDRGHWRTSRNDAVANGYDFDYAEHLIGIYTYAINLLNWVLRDSEEERSES